MTEPLKTSKCNEVRSLKSMENEINIKQNKTLKTNNEEQTNATLPIHDNVVIICEGGKNLMVFFRSTSSKHPLFPRCLVHFFGEVVEPTISLEIVTHLLEVRV